MDIGNLFALSPPTAMPAPSSDELFEELLRGGPFELKRIVSTGQTTPAGEWYDQETDEWVVLLRGAARLVFEDDEEPIEMRPGDYLNIGAHRRHRVEWTDPTQPTVWLALHYRATVVGRSAN